VTPSRRKFVLRVPDALAFKRGRVNLIIGPTGSGKTSLLMALLGEMHFQPLTPGAWVNLPREGGVAYAAQESWVQNETIRDNILFGAPYDEDRYNKGTVARPHLFVPRHLNTTVQLSTSAASNAISRSSRPATRRRSARRV
jgi:ABC-type multidrug transport system fused ATPase/permease subunit